MFMHRFCRSTDVFVLRVLAGLPADTLQGHRDRFEEQFKKYEAPFAIRIALGHSFTLTEWDPED